MKLLQHFMVLSSIALLWIGCKEAPEHLRSGAHLVNKNVEKKLDSTLQLKDAGKSFSIISRLYRLPSDSITHAFVCHAMARWYFLNGSNDTVIVYTRMALPYLEQHTDFTRTLGDCYYMLGLCLRQSSEPNSFLSNYYLTKAALLCSSPGADTIFPFRFRAVIPGLASLSNRECQLFDPSLQYARTAVSISRQYQDSIPLEYIESLTTYSRILVEKKLYDSALYYCNAARIFNEQKAHSELMSQNIDAAVGGYYFAKGYLDSAASCCLRAIEFQEKSLEPTAPAAIFSGYSSMLGIYDELHRPKDAKKYLDKAEKLLAKNKSVADAAALKDFAINKILYNILYSNSASTGTLFSDYVQQEKSFYNKEQLKMEESTFAEYDLANKERKIQALNVQRLAAEADLQARNSLLAIAALATLLAISGIIVLILLQRQRKLKNTQQMLSVEHHKIELEQQLLRAQMEPHFIFNTLTNLLTLIDKHENKKASEYVLRFANLLRTNLENSRESHVLLSEELDALENYLALQKMRFNDLFDFRINMDTGIHAKHLCIPPMLIQPLVENAIIHGFKSIDYKGMIEISIKADNSLLYCTVQDNGVGYNAARKKGRQGASSAITKERLAILSRQTGQTASLEIIKGDEENGMKIELIVPFTGD